MMISHPTMLQLFAPTATRARHLDQSVTHDGTLVRQLVAQWHSTLPPSVGFIAAFILSDGNCIYGVSTWGRPVSPAEDGREDTIQHTRMALAPFAPRNSGSRFLRLNREWLRAHTQFTRCLAYVDEKYHTGIIYRADNWRIVYEHQPNNSSWMNRAGRHTNGCTLRTKFEREP